MTRKEIARNIRKALPKEFFTKKSAQLSFDFVPPAPVGIKRAEECCDIVIGAIKRTLIAGESVEIRGFGKFVVRWKKERKGRNPKTGEDLVIAARGTVSFRPSNMLRDRVKGEQD